MAREATPFSSRRRRLLRGFGTDAYDLYFFREHVLTQAQLQRQIRPMLATKFAVAPALVAHPDLQQPFDEQTAQAERLYGSGSVVLSGAPPAWSTVASSLPLWRALLSRRDAHHDG